MQPDDRHRPTPPPFDRAATPCEPAAGPARLLNRDFMLLWQGQAVSQVGNQAFTIAMMYWLMQATGSATLMGLLMMSSLLPGIVLAPVGGTLADRLSRKRIIVMSDLLRGIAVLGVAAVIYGSPTSTGHVIGALFAVSIFNGLVGAVFQPAIAAVIPDLVPADRLAAANSMNQFSIKAAILLGQSVGGILYRLFGAPLLFLIDGITYLLSALSECFIRLPKRKRAPLERTSGMFSGFRSDVLEGLHYLWRRPGMRDFLMIVSFINFLAMPTFVLLPFFVADRLGQGAEWFGFLLAAMGAGSIAGFLVAGSVAALAGRRRSMILAAMLAVGAAVTGLGIARDPWAALSAYAAVGFGTGIVNVLSLTLFQIAAPAAMRGRILSLVFALSSAAAPLGMVFGGMLGDATDNDFLTIFAGSGTLIAATTLGARLHRPVSAFLALDADEPRA